MKAIIGLGNIGEKYLDNRHNVGFKFLESIKGYFKIKKKNRLRHGIIYECNFKSRKLLLVQPTTFMNLSGLSVKEARQVYNLKLSDLLIVHDDLDIELGKYKLQKAKGPLGHNGILDIENKMKTKNFFRLRIGVENRTDKFMAGEDYVLSDFSKQELVVIDNVFKLAWQEVLERFILDWQRKK